LVYPLKTISHFIRTGRLTEARTLFDSPNIYNVGTTLTPLATNVSSMATYLMQEGFLSNLVVFII